MGMTVDEQTTVGKARGKRDHRDGIVVSDKADKTIKVRYEYIVKHRKYGKYYRRSTTLHTHDEANEAKTGDRVEVAACRRRSKTKCWRLVRVLHAVATGN
ncbi:MAG: 30S ribosomal protein S17 [Phycisphaerae bacterium]